MQGEGEKNEKGQRRMKGGTKENETRGKGDKIKNVRSGKEQ
jgi:hypothetical protein